jgi:hypothetical protein
MPQGTADDIIRIIIIVVVVGRAGEAPRVSSRPTSRIYRMMA